MGNLRVHDAEYQTFSERLKSFESQSLAERAEYQSKLDQITRQGLIDGDQAENIRTFAMQMAMIGIDIDLFTERLKHLPTFYIMEVDDADNDIYF